MPDVAHAGVERRGQVDSVLDGKGGEPFAKAPRRVPVVTTARHSVISSSRTTQCERVGGPTDDEQVVLAQVDVRDIRHVQRDR